MPNSPIPAAGEAMPMSRRKALGLLAAVAVPPTAVVAVAAVSNPGHGNPESNVAESPDLVGAYQRFLSAKTELAESEDALEWLVAEWRHLWPSAPEDILSFGNADQHTENAERDIAGRIIKRNTADLGKRCSLKWSETHPQACFGVFTPEELQKIISMWEKPRTGRTEKALARKLIEQGRALAEYRHKLRLSEQYHAETARLRVLSGVAQFKQRVKTAKAELDRACNAVSYEPAHTVTGLRLKAEVLQTQDNGTAPFMRSQRGALGGMARFIEATLDVIGRASA